MTWQGRTDELRRTLQQFAVQESPFTSRPEIPAADRRRVTWVDRSLTVEIRYTSTRPDGRLRHPALVRFRPDK